MLPALHHHCCPGYGGDRRGPERCTTTQVQHILLSWFPAGHNLNNYSETTDSMTVVLIIPHEPDFSLGVLCVISRFFGTKCKGQLTKTVSCTK